MTKADEVLYALWEPVAGDKVQWLNIKRSRRVHGRIVKVLEDWKGAGTFVMVHREDDPEDDHVSVYGPWPLSRLVRD